MGIVLDTRVIPPDPVDIKVGHLVPADTKVKAADTRVALLVPADTKVGLPVLVVIREELVAEGLVVTRAEPAAEGPVVIKVVPVVEGLVGLIALVPEDLQVLPKPQVKKSSLKNSEPKKAAAMLLELGKLNLKKPLIYQRKIA